MPTELTCRVTKTRLMSCSKTLTTINSVLGQESKLSLQQQANNLSNSHQNSQQKEPFESGSKAQQKQKNKTTRIKEQQINFQIVCELKFADQTQTSDLFTQTDFKLSEEESVRQNCEETENIWQGQLAQESLFKFDIFLDDEMIQEHQMTVTLKDQNSNAKNNYSPDSEDCIGVTQIDLSPLLFQRLPQKSRGWFPLYYVDKGITGEIYLELSLVYQPDLAVEKPTGFYQPKIAYFSSKAPPYFEVKQIVGFVEELVDFKLSSTIQEDQVALQDAILRLRRRLGRIVSKKGGNTVICYRQSIDHTGAQAKRVILRGYGTAVLLKLDAMAMAETKQKSTATNQQNSLINQNEKSQKVLVQEDRQMLQMSCNAAHNTNTYAYGGVVGASMIGGEQTTNNGQMIIGNPNVTNTQIQNQNNNPNVVGNNQAAAYGDTTAQKESLVSAPFQLLGQNQQNSLNFPLPWTSQKPLLDGQVKHKVQLITTDALPQDNGTTYSVKFGSTVMACAVRKLSSYTVYEQEASKRLTSKIASEWNQWWGQVRQEIQISAKALNCSHVMGYREQVSINQQILVLEAYGTAVNIRAKQTLNALQRQQNSQIGQIQSQRNVASVVQGLSGICNHQQGIPQDSLSQLERQLGGVQGGNVVGNLAGGQNNTGGTGTRGNSKSKDLLRMSKESSVGAFPARLNSSGGGGKKLSTSQQKMQDLRSKNKSLQFEHQSPLLRNMQSNFPAVFPQIAQSVTAGGVDKQHAASDGAATSAQGSDQQKSQQKLIPNHHHHHSIKVKEDIQACRFCHIVPPRKRSMFQDDDQQKVISQQMQEKFQHKCLICGDKYVPETIIATIDPPDGLQILGKPILLEARAIKVKKLNPRRTQTLKEDHFLMTLNDQVFVTKYHLHNQLLTKMRLAGKNALFSYRAKVNINHDSITGIATGTALCLRALPLPKPIKIVPYRHLLSELRNRNGDTDHPNATQNLFKLIGEFSQFNVRMAFEQDIISIQSPYTYLRVLPRKRAAQNLIVNEEEMVVLAGAANQQKQDTPNLDHIKSKIDENSLPQNQTNVVKVKVNVNLKKKGDDEQIKDNKQVRTHQRQLFQDPPLLQQKSIKHNLNEGKIKSVNCGFDDEISCEMEDVSSSQFQTAHSSQNQLIINNAAINENLAKPQAQEKEEKQSKTKQIVEDEESKNKDPETPRESRFFLLQHKDTLQQEQNNLQQLSGQKTERKQLSEVKDEHKMTVIVNDPFMDVQNKLHRIDFSGLKPDPIPGVLNEENSAVIPPIVKFRSGSMEDKANMELLIASQKPSVLVIRSKKQSLDEEVAREQLEVESYKFRLEGKSKAARWTKETILSGSYTKIPNYRALSALQMWQAQAQQQAVNNGFDQNKSQSQLIQQQSAEMVERNQNNSTIDRLVDIYNNNQNFASNGNSSLQSTDQDLISKQKLKESMWAEMGSQPQNQSHLLALQEQKTAISVLKLKKCGLAVPLTTPEMIQTEKSQEQKEQKVENNLLAVKVDPQEIPIEDQNDIEILQTLLDPLMPPQVVLLTTQYDMINFNFQNMVTIKKVSFFTRLYRYDLYRDQRNFSQNQRSQTNHKARGLNSKSKNRLLETEFNRIMQGAKCDLVSDLIKEGYAPCVVCSLRTQEKFHSDNFVDIFFTCCILQSSSENTIPRLSTDSQKSKKFVANPKLNNVNQNFPNKSEQAKSNGEVDSQFASGQQQNLQHYLQKMAYKEQNALMSSNLKLPSHVQDWIDRRTGLRVGGKNIELTNFFEQNASYQPKVNISQNYKMSVNEQSIGNNNQTQIGSSIQVQKSIEMAKVSSQNNSSKSSFFSFLCGTSKKQSNFDKQALQTIRYCKDKAIESRKIKMFPMSVYPGLTIKKHFGLVDVHLFRKIDLSPKNQSVSKYQKTSCSDVATLVQKAIDELIEDLGEVIGSRVRSLGGNAVTGIRFDLGWLDAQSSHQNWQTQGDYLTEYLVIVSGTGDAVQLEES